MLKVRKRPIHATVMKKCYLGDGVYVEVVDGFSLRLTTENGAETTNTIWLEPDTYEALTAFVKEIPDEHAGAGLPQIEAALRRLAGLPAFVDVSSISVGDGLILSLSNPESALPRQIASGFGVILRKEAALSGEHLVVRGTIDGVALAIYKYRPAACRVEYEEVSTVKLVARITCAPERAQEALRQCEKRQG